MLPRAQSFAAALADACRRVYGPDLVAVALFGSYAKGTATPASDIDVLVVAEPLPAGRGRRLAQFEPVDAETLPHRAAVWAAHAEPTPVLSPVIKTPAEVRAGSPLFLDMTDGCDLLVDRAGFLAGYLADLRGRMAALGTVRRPAKGGYYWDYKPGARPREVIEL